MSDEITERDLLEAVRATAQEILDWNPDATDIDQLPDNTLNESADGLVNVYTYPCAQEWLAVGMPLTEDLVGETFEGDVHEQIRFGMYFWYQNQLIEELTELLDARNEATA